MKHFECVNCVQNDVVRFVQSQNRLPTTDEIRAIITQYEWPVHRLRIATVHNWMTERGWEPKLVDAPNR